MSAISAAITGSGNIGTDLMMKVLRRTQHLKLAAVIGVDPNSEAAAQKHGLKVIDILTELGRRRVVDGQEDMIVDVAPDLLRNGGRAASQHNKSIREPSQ